MVVNGMPWFPLPPGVFVAVRHVFRRGAASDAAVALDGTTWRLAADRFSIFCESVFGWRKADHLKSWFVLFLFVAMEPLPEREDPAAAAVLRPEETPVESKMPGGL
jgi:hypothetical protein